jgi:hypothetical protein
MAHYKGDPEWITCRFVGKCRQCGKAIAVGQQAFRYKSGALYGRACGCGEAASRSFDAAAFDESVMTGQW